MPDECKIYDKLELAHKWVHLVMDELTEDQLVLAHKFGQRILNLLNNTEGVAEAPNGVKLLAVFEALSVGVDHLEAHAVANETATVH